MYTPIIHSPHDTPKLSRTKPFVDKGARARKGLKKRNEQNKKKRLMTPHNERTRARKKTYMRTCAALGASPLFLSFVGARYILAAR